MFPKQRFIVVKTMVCRVILGIDLLSRAESVSFDFNESCILMNYCKIKFHQHPSDIVKSKRMAKEAVPLQTKDVVVPGRSVALVQCLASKLETGTEYMVEPITSDDSFISTPYGLIEGAEEVYVRMTNLGGEEVRISKGETIAVAHTGEWVRDVKIDEGFKSKSANKSKDIDFESMVSPKLESNKKKHLMEI